MYNSVPKVSILIPTYNQQHFLRQAIESALQQDYQNLEVIVSDDCSTDSTQEIIDLYIPDSRFKYFKNEINIGRIANYQKLLYEYATGEWVLMLDGDDYFIDTNYIAECVQIVMDNNKNNVDIAFIQAGRQVKSIVSEKSFCQFPKISSTVKIIKGDLYFLNFVSFKHFSNCSTFYNRIKAITVGFYIHNNLSTDIESFLKLSLSGYVVLIKKVVVVWIQHGSNASKNMDMAIHLENLNWIKRCKEYAQVKLPNMEKKLNRWYKETLDNYLIALLNFIQVTPDTLALSIKRLNILSHYISKVKPGLIFNFRFLAYYLYTFINILRKPFT